MVTTTEDKLVIVDTRRQSARTVEIRQPRVPVQAFAWHPKGESFACITDARPPFNLLIGRKSDLHAAPALTEGSGRVARGAVPLPSVAWSRDGNWIAYTERGPDGDSVQAMAMHLGTRKVRMLYRGSLLVGLAWSPRGAQLFVEEYTTNGRPRFVVVDASAAKWGAVRILRQ
jgi:hypothetical protein